MTPIAHSFFHGPHKVILETGCVAKHADAAVMVQVGDTVVLVTVSLGKEPVVRPKFLPLSVHYQEKSYAAGKIPGSFFRREGRPGEGEVLISRLIDRSIRPLIAKNFSREIQVIATVLSVDPQIYPDIPAMIGASAALHLSSVPFDGPLFSSRIGFIEDVWVINPRADQREQSRLDLIVSSNQSGIVMVEASAKELPESEILGSLQSTHALHQTLIKEIEFFSEKCDAAGHKKAKVIETLVDQEEAFKFFELNRAAISSHFEEWMGFSEKSDRLKAAQAGHTWLEVELQKYCKERNISLDDASLIRDQVFTLYATLKNELIRQRILKERVRVDGRVPEAVRALDIRVGILPKTHGSCLFTRGGTQALATITLGNDRDAQQVDDLVGNKSEHFLLHYNFPPFCVGEVGLLGSPKRREIGHGALAKRALMAVMPSLEEFPYAVRIVSEILESDGSSSMATVCAASLALMDAGAPIKRSVAGVAMGLVIASKEEWVVLSDINAFEDHIGDMDFKVAGSLAGVTALQMDVKVPGISGEMLEASLLQAKAARLHILRTMDSALSEPSAALSQLVPKYYRLQIPANKIKDLVGKGGAVVKRLSSEFNASIDIADSGAVKLCVASEKDAAALQERILLLVGDLEIGAIYQGKVTRIEPFGAFVELLGSGKNGLVHISELNDVRVSKVTDCVNISDSVLVRVLATDSKTGRIRLSMKGIQEVSDRLDDAAAPKKPALESDEESCSSDSTTDTAHLDEASE